MYIKKSIERVSNFIEVGNEREAMMLLRDLEANVVRYDFEIMGDGFNKFAEIYVSQKNRFFKKKSNRNVSKSNPIL
ncbi:hypothetical protein NIT62_09330 [Mammaliicoccus sciuri]|nr:hypothetical protein NIT62_09330 [Mammaliicoccus sciuri]